MQWWDINMHGWAPPWLSSTSSSPTRCIPISLPHLTSLTASLFSIFLCPRRLVFPPHSTSPPAPPSQFPEPLLYFLAFLSPSFTPPHPTGLLCCCYATLLPLCVDVIITQHLLLLWNTDEQQDQSNKRTVEKQQGVWLNKKKKSHSECAFRVIGHVCMCNKDDEGDISVCRPNCASFAIYCLFVSQPKSASHYSCCSCSMTHRQGQIHIPRVIKSQFISYAWYKIQLGHYAAVACVQYMVKTIQIHPTKTRLYKKRENKPKYHKIKNLFSICNYFSSCFE